MALLDDILVHNARWVEERNRPVSKVPRKRIAIFTCMDTRMVEFLEQSMGLGRGDAKVIKNAGNTLIDPDGGVVRSLVVAVYVLGCEEIYVVGHTDCGMSQVDAEKLEQQMIERGVPAAAFSRLRPGFRQWLGAFKDPVGNVQKVVETLRASDLITNDIPIHGLMFDQDRGNLAVITRGDSPA